jgi:ketosteroid isomerase-like protein
VDLYKLCDNSAAVSSGGKLMRKPLTLVLCLLALTLSSFAQEKSASKKSAGAMPDKAYLQKIWDGWSTLDPNNTAQFYAPGDHTFFDIAPLKYNNWDEYKAGVTKVLADYKSAKFTVNDDAQVHPAGEYVWGTATVKSDMTQKYGKREMGAFRWTMVFHKEGGKWLIVHEHVSEPLQ